MFMVSWEGCIKWPFSMLYGDPDMFGPAVVASPGAEVSFLGSCHDVWTMLPLVIGRASMLPSHSLSGRMCEV